MNREQYEYLLEKGMGTFKRLRPKPRKEEPRSQLTVGELIALLQGVDETLLVETEGCDCYGVAVSIEVEKPNTLIIRR